MSPIFSNIPPFIIDLILKYKYFILFPVLIVEGPIATIASGILASPSFNKFNIIPLFFFVVFADVFGDTLYYLLGKYAGPRIIRKIKEHRGVTVEYENRIQNFFSRYGKISILLGKITHGFGWPIMVLAGSMRMQYKTFILYCITASIVKTAALLAIGYYYSKDYALFSFYIGSHITGFLTLGIIAFILWQVVSQMKK